MLDVAVIGAGLAGLITCRTLCQNYVQKNLEFSEYNWINNPEGLFCQNHIQNNANHQIGLFEARATLGGRLRTQVKKGTVWEEGATIVSADHHLVRGLAKEFNLSLEPMGKNTLFFQNNEPIIIPSLQSTNLKTLSDLYSSYMLDSTGYLDGVDEEYHQILTDLISQKLEHCYFPQGISQLVDALFSTIPKDNFNCWTNHQLLHVSYDSDGKYYRLIFAKTDEGNRQVIILARKIVITIPFSVLRQSVEIDSSVLISEETRNYIKHLRYAQHTKIGIPLNIEQQQQVRDVGYLIDLNRKQWAWITLGYLTIFSANLNYDAQDAIDFFRTIFNATPIIIYEKHWSNDKFTLGSYSSPQFSDHPQSHLEDHNLAFFVENENKTCYFAGEHTVLDEKIGYMEGAIYSGQKVAQFILNLLPRNQ